MSGYVFNVLLAFDLLSSAVTGGKPGSTLSGRAGRAQDRGVWWGKFWAPIINCMSQDPQHCASAVRNDIPRARAGRADESRGEG